MSYYKAQQCFQDSLLYIDVEKDPAAHDLNTGLSELTAALESDFADIQNRLDQISATLRELTRK